MVRLLRSALIIVVLALMSQATEAGHRVLTHGNGKLAIVDAAGKIEWEMPWGGIHDIHLLPNGHILTTRDFKEVVEIDPETKKVVWSYNSSTQNGNAGKKVEIHAIQPLANGQIMIAESGPARLIEIDRAGTIQTEIKLKVNHPSAHRDTRLVRKIANGNYLVCHEGDGALREYEGKSGKVIWEFQVPMFGKQSKGGHGLEAFGNSLYGALRLKNGNTLISTGNGHSVLEVTPQKEIVWELHQDDLAGIRFAWVTTLEVHPNGNYMIGNCHAGPGNPLLVELNPQTKKVVWTFDHFDVFGNSVPSSQILGIKGNVNR